MKARQEYRIPRRHEAFTLRLLGKRYQRVEVAFDIEQSNRFAVKTDLRPGHDFEELVARAEAARQRDERVGEIRHHGLALVHALRHAELREPAVRHFPREEAAGQDTDHASAG